ncbi:MAG: endonuclease/exonuclease/phosphatase family protein [Akkermansiaceae bacterium]|nr:endonuclease/exonuclease/phosphatase family protein [Akkermansiaceae bacterium]
MWQGILAIALACAPLGAAGLRVVTFNIETHRNDEGWPDYALGDPAGPDFTSVASILARIDADVVALQEVHSGDLTGSPKSEVQLLGEALGLPYLHAGSNAGNFDTSLRVVILSRYPFLSTASILSPAGAKEIARHCPAVVVDVPGTTEDPLVISAHLKSGTTTADRFRRAIEMRRLVEFLENSAYGVEDNFIILGDFNPSSSTTTFSALPSGLPTTFSLGSDVALPVTYRPQMLTYFQSKVPALLDPRQRDGDDGTYEFGQTLDLIFVSPALAGRPYAAEVYDSAEDHAIGGGLLKPGPMPAVGASALASDHYAVFADFELEPDLGSLGLVLSQTSIIEGGTGAVVTATLPQAATAAVSIELSASPAGPVLGASTLVIPAGQTSGATTIAMPRDFAFTGNRNFTLGAVAGGFDPAEVVLTVVEADGVYALTEVGAAVTEEFTGFAGSAAPSPWVAVGAAAAWLGSDGGALASGGARSYGSGGDGSLGVGGVDAVFEAEFRNLSGKRVSLLDVSYFAEQWRATLNGAEGRIEAELVADGAVIAIPGLTHVARTDLPSGAVAGGLETLKQARVTGLDLAAGEDFKLRFRFAGDEGSVSSSADVWVNEVHYENTGDDSGEFIEVVMGPGFAGNPSDIGVWRYNGATASAATTYGTILNLGSDFGFSGNYGGYRFFTITLPKDGLQNGFNDGFAVVNVATSTVLHLISYEGSFTASNGPAAGMTAVNMGVSQSGTTPVGASLGLTGSALDSAGFTWTSYTVASKGAPNAGQVFSAASLGWQGLAVDRLAVAIVGDHDGDGLADEDDADDDNDGMSDANELAFGTDPMDAAAVFRVEVVDGALRFPGAEGVLYTVEWCDDLVSWDHSAVIEGQGNGVVFPLPPGEQKLFLRVRAGE